MWLRADVQVFPIPPDYGTSDLCHMWEERKQTFLVHFSAAAWSVSTCHKVPAFISAWQTNCKLPGNALKQPWNIASASLICFHEAGQLEQKPPLTLRCMKKDFLFFLASLGRQTDGPIDWQMQTDGGRADLKTAPTVDINLYLASGSVKLGHLLMCVMLHNRLCQPKGWGTPVSVVCETRECKRTLQAWWVMHQLEYPFRAKAALLGGHYNSPDASLSVTPGNFDASGMTSPREKRLQCWDSWRVTKWANKIC